MSLPETSNPSNVPAPKPTYSHVCTTRLSPSTKLITIAGQIGVDTSTGKAPPDFPSQVRCALANLGACLAAAGASPRDIVKVTHYVVGEDLIGNLDRGRLYVEFVGAHRPPSTLVGVKCLAEPEYLYEIEAMAVVNEEVNQ